MLTKVTVLFLLLAVGSLFVTTTAAASVAAKQMKQVPMKKRKLKQDEDDWEWTQTRTEGVTEEMTMSPSLYPHDGMTMLFNNTLPNFKSVMASLHVRAAKGVVAVISNQANSDSPACTINAFNGTNGLPMWIADDCQYPSGSLRATPMQLISDMGLLIHFNSGAKHICARHIMSGETVWCMQLSKACNGYSTACIFAASSSVVVVSEGMGLRAIHARTGRQLWKASTPIKNEGLAVNEDTVFAASWTRLMGLNAWNGTLRWSHGGVFSITPAGAVGKTSVAVAQQTPNPGHYVDNWFPQIYDAATGRMLYNYTHNKEGNQINGVIMRKDREEIVVQFTSFSMADNNYPGGMVCLSASHPAADYKWYYFTDGTLSNAHVMERSGDVAVIDEDELVILDGEQGRNLGDLGGFMDYNDFGQPWSDELGRMYFTGYYATPSGGQINHLFGVNPNF